MNITDRSWRVALLTLAGYLSIGLACADATPDASELAEMAARFAPVDVTVDLTTLPENERAALAKLIEASRYVDALFVRQRSAINEALLLELLADVSPLGRARLDYFLLNKGPWSELDEDRPFLPGVAPKSASGQLLSARRNARGSRDLDEIVAGS